MVEVNDQNQRDMSDRDLLEIHSAVFREPADPSEGSERGPWWLWVGIILTVFGGGFYLGRYGGAFFQNVVHVGYIDPWVMSPADPVPLQPEFEVGPDGLLDIGERVYAANCVACHQGDGEGLPGLFPPLAQSEWVIEDAQTVVRVIVHGMMGPVEVRGTQYDGLMPGWLPTFSLEEIVAVTNYIRSSWGNDASPVDLGLVQEVIDQDPTRGPWTAEELTQVRGLQ